MKELKKKVDVNDDTALEKILNIQPKPYEYEDVINRGTKRVYGFTHTQTICIHTYTNYMYIYESSDERI